LLAKLADFEDRDDQDGPRQRCVPELGQLLRFRNGALAAPQLLIS
jgi:hypothetical protein